MEFIRDTWKSSSSFVENLISSPNSSPPKENSPGSPIRKALIFKEDGNSLYKQQKFAEAAQKYSAAIELCQNETSFYFNRSLCYSALGLWRNAADDALRCISISSAYMKGYYRAAIALQALGEHEKALEIICNGLRIFPNNKDLERMHEKLQIYTSLARWKADGDAQFGREDYGAAIESYTKCITNNPDEGSELALKCVSNRALCHMHTGYHSGTVEDCSLVLKQKPNDIKALIRRSEAAECLGLLETALIDVQAVLALGPTALGPRLSTLANELARRLQRLIEERESPMRLLRKASADESFGAVCFCLEPMVPGFNTVRLRCRCVLHEHCIVSYIRSRLGDKSSIRDNGVPCPYGCGGSVWIDDVDALCGLSAQRPVSALHGTGVSPLLPEESGKFRLWVISASFRQDELVACPTCATPHWVDRGENGEGSGATMVRCSNASCRERFCCGCQVRWHVGMSCEEYQQGRARTEDSNALVAATAKRCPNCHTPVTHYHGHACHHIRGCPGCGCHFCYVCLSTEDENDRLRGERSRCVCEEGRWATFCKDEEVLEHLDLSPFPHDRRCGCPICPDCRRGHPCANCHGDCVVCTGVVQSGPVELHNYCVSEARSYLAGCFKDAGKALFVRGEYEAAAAKFTLAIAQNPDVTCYSNRSACYAALDQWERSADDAQECVRVDASFAKGHLRLATALVKLNRPLEAVVAAKAGLAVDAKCAQLRQLLTSLHDSGIVSDERKKELNT